MAEQTKSVRDVLIEARALIAAPERWTKGVLARTAGGEPVDAYSDRAECFCADGAIRHVTGRRHEVACEAMLSLAAAMGNGSIEGVNVADFNDAHEHADVIAAFDRAIAAAPGTAPAGREPEGQP